MKQESYRCGDCGGILPKRKILRARNPFCEEEIILGCPICFSPDNFIRICDEPKCKKDGTCGTPTKNGYRHTCYEHIPREE